MIYPLVSVLIPTYNDNPEFLKLALNSVIKQTYKPTEIIIVDDSTSLETIETIDEYVQQNPHISVIRNHNKKKGLSAALNEGVKYCKGDYIARMDADDLSLPNRIELEMSAFADNVAIVGGQGVIINKDGEFIRKFDKLPLTHKGIVNNLKRAQPSFIHPSVIIRKKALLECGGYDENFQCAEDMNLWIRLSQNHYVKNINDIVLMYRKYGGNASTVMSERQNRAVTANQLLSVFGAIKPLSDMQFNKVMQIVSKNRLCRLYYFTMEKTSLFIKRVFSHLNVYYLLSNLIWLYFAASRVKLKKMVFIDK